MRKRMGAEDNWFTVFTLYPVAAVIFCCNNCVRYKKSGPEGMSICTVEGSVKMPVVCVTDTGSGIIETAFVISCDVPVKAVNTRRKQIYFFIYHSLCER